MIGSVVTLFGALGSECKNSFPILRPWYNYLTVDDPKGACEIKNFTFLPPHSDIPLVLLAIIDDLLRIAGIMAVAFVIVGAINFITSEGKPEATAKAQATLINALIGLVVAIVAISFITFLGRYIGNR